MDWIYWHLLLQSLSIKNDYNSSQSIFCWGLASILIGLRLSSLLLWTDFVLIYKPVTSSSSTFCWLTLHSWTLNSVQLLNFELSYECWMMTHLWITKNEWWMKNEKLLANDCRINYISPLITWGRTEYKLPLPRIPLLFCVHLLLQKHVCIL
jgi:hypothetical protein